MMEPLNPHSLRRDLSSFADGELDAAATERLLQHLMTDPASVETLRRLQHLTTAARRAVRNHTPPPSEFLRERLRQITNAEAEKPAASPRPQVAQSGWRPLPRAVAAAVLLVIGAWVGHRMTPKGEAVLRPNRDETAVDVLPAVIVAQAEEIHGFCSRLAEGLHTGGYPADVAALASSVEHDLHGDHPYPDLRPIGFRYRGAGPCGKPMADTAHLLYRSVQPGSVRAVSVFVQPWREQYPLAASRLYTVSVATSPFPMLAWRTDSVVYFLLADDTATEQNAVALIRGTPATGPSALDP